MTLARLILTIPEDLLEHVIQAVGAVAEQAGQVIRGRVELEGEAPVKVRRAPRVASPIGVAGGKGVVYRVLDAATPLSESKARVRTYILQHTPHRVRAGQVAGVRARAIVEAHPEWGRKGIESALHGLRSRGMIESVRVPGGASC